MGHFRWQYLLPTFISLIVFISVILIKENKIFTNSIMINLNEYIGLGSFICMLFFFFAFINMGKFMRDH